MSDADCDGIPDTEDESPDYGTGTYGGSSGTNDADNDGIPDGTDPTPYGEGSNGGTDNGNGEGVTDDGRSSGGGGTSGRASGPDAPEEAGRFLRRLSGRRACAAGIEP